MKQAIIDATREWADEEGLTTAEKNKRLAANRRGPKAVERMERGLTVGICINERCTVRQEAEIK